MPRAAGFPARREYNAYFDGKQHVGHVNKYALPNGGKLDCGYCHKPTSKQAALTIPSHPECYICHALGSGDAKASLKVSRSVKLVPIKGSVLADGSFLTRITGKVDGQMQEMTVRVIVCRLRGFRSFRLITNLRDKKITAREIAKHCHQRWEIEIAFDEIKTHQCARLRGQIPTIFRSKRADLIKQELYALMITYTTMRLLMQRAAAQVGKKPVEISFLDTLQAIIDAVPLFNWKQHPHSEEELLGYLLSVIAASEIECARRPRINPRVVKVKMSKFARKNKRHRGETRDFDKDLSILAPWQPKTKINGTLKQAA